MDITNFQYFVILVVEGRFDIIQQSVCPTVIALIHFHGGILFCIIIPKYILNFKVEIIKIHILHSYLDVFSLIIFPRL